MAFMTLVCVFVAACGGGSSSSNVPPTPETTVAPVSFKYNPGAAHVPTCTHAGNPIPLPAAFPAGFPFPVGTVIDRTMRLPGHLVGIYGFVPSQTFVGTVNFFHDQVKRAGFSVLDFEVDSPHDSEGTYRGHHAVGRWQLRALPSCKEAMSFEASAGTTK